MRLTSFAIALVLAPCATALAQVVPAAEAEQIIEFELRDGDRVIGAPQLPLEIGRTVAISVGDSYSARVRIERAATGGYLVRSSLARADAIDGVRLAAPELTVAQGTPARVRLAGAANLSIGVTIR